MYTDLIIGYDGTPAGRDALALDAGLYDHEWMDAAIADAGRERDQALRDVGVAHHGQVVAGLVGEQLVKRA